MASNKSEDIRIRREFSERLNLALDEIGVPPKHNGRQTVAVKMFGITQKGVRRWLEAEGLPRPRDWAPIAKKLNVRVEWLMFGLGEMRPREEAFDTTFMQRIIVTIDKAKETCGLVLTDGQRARLVTFLYESLRQK